MVAGLVSCSHLTHRCFHNYWCFIIVSSTTTSQVQEIVHNSDHAGSSYSISALLYLNPHHCPLLHICKLYWWFSSYSCLVPFTCTHPYVPSGCHCILVSMAPIATQWGLSLTYIMSGWLTRHTANKLNLGSMLLHNRKSLTYLLFSVWPWELTLWMQCSVLTCVPNKRRGQSSQLENAFMLIAEIICLVDPHIYLT